MSSDVEGADHDGNKFGRTHAHPRTTPDAGEGPTTKGSMLAKSTHPLPGAYGSQAKEDWAHSRTTKAALLLRSFLQFMSTSSSRHHTGLVFLADHPAGLNARPSRTMMHHAYRMCLFAM